jgi:hypothetical protein
MLKKYITVFFLCFLITACQGGNNKISENQINTDDIADLNDTAENDSGERNTASGSDEPGNKVTPDPGDENKNNWDINDFSYIYEVGPGKQYTTPNDVPWESLQPSSIIRIHYRLEPYRTKWVISTFATENDPVVILGIPDNNGNLPIISGDNATYRTTLYYLNDERSVVKVGNYTGSNDQDRPAWIFIENLDIRTGRPGYYFTNRNNQTEEYNTNAASIHIEEGNHIAIKGCIIHDSGNGIFAGHFSSNILISGNIIFDNGFEGDSNRANYYEHNTYTGSNGIIYEYNYMGPLRAGCGGNNLKDRSTGTIIRYNYIEAGSRQLDLVESRYFYQEPDYNETFVYGNILVEPDIGGNSQIIHYGGDSNPTKTYYYRQGTIHIYHNTIISKRSGNTTLIRLSLDNAAADIRNNIIYTTSNRLALTNGRGNLYLFNNWLTNNYQNSFEPTSATILDESGNLTGREPGFMDFNLGNFHLAAASPCLSGSTNQAAATTAHPVLKQYIKPGSYELRNKYGNTADMGAYER